MKIHPPTLGPVLGYTTHEQARIWLRGEMQMTATEVRRAFAVVQVREAKKRSWSKPIIQKLMPYFDMTGVCVFTGLKSDTDYVYRAGWFFSDAEWKTLSSENTVAQWTEFEEIPFRTGSSNSAKPRSYVAGSCRYLLRIFGSSFFDDRGDKTFSSIASQMEVDGRPLDGLIMAGDQVYADDLNLLHPDKSFEQFLERYRAVFAQPAMRRLMGRVPTYMILDDHEIEDNWPAKATSKDKLTIYPAAIHAYQIYQASHSPLFDLDSEGYITGTPERLWYNFTDGCVDCFVIDSRTERLWNEDPAKRRMISPKQMEALLEWLADGSGRVKLMVTSVPMFPDLRTENDDKWGGFLAERSQILDHILSNKVQKVVVLSGDVHCSFTVELTAKDHPDFKIHTVVSSSFFWPYPHMREEQFSFNAPLTSAGTNKYLVGTASEVHSTDNFGRLDFTPESFTVTFFDRKGKQLGQPVSKSFA